MFLHIFAYNTKYYNKEKVMASYNMYKLSSEQLKDFGILEHSRKPFGQALKDLAGISGISQPELGKALHVTATTIHNYFHGYRTNPDIEFMRRCADFFDVKPSYFKEYRINLINEKLSEFPELIDIIATSLSDPKKLIREYKDEYEDYKKNIRRCGIKV